MPTQCCLLAVLSMRNSRNNVTPGWLGFWDCRVKPQGDYSPRVHGNWRHGRYAKETSEGRKLMRQIRRTLRTGAPLDVVSAPSPGWRLYPFV